MSSTFWHINYWYCCIGLLMIQGKISLLLLHFNAKIQLPVTSFCKNVPVCSCLTSIVTSWFYYLIPEMSRIIIIIVIIIIIFIMIIINEITGSCQLVFLGKGKLRSKFTQWRPSWIWAFQVSGPPQLLRVSLMIVYTCQDHVLESLILDSKYSKMTPKFVKKKSHWLHSSTEFAN